MLKRSASATPHGLTEGDGLATERAFDDTDGPSPAIEVRQEGAAAGEGGTWQVAFDVTNGGQAPLHLLAAWLPHGRFRSDEQSFDGVVLSPGERTTLVFQAAFEEPTGTEVENCFVILRVAYAGGTWRVLARFRVRSGAGGEPAVTTELITAHRVGFSA